MSRKTLILASGSRTRQAMLQQTGLQFTVQPADLDEAGIIAAAREQRMAPAAIAAKLALAKAQTVAAGTAGALVIGADQVLVCENMLYQKASDLAEARAQLQQLHGKTHQLISAACVVCDNAVLWQQVDRAQLTMKNFDDAFLTRYLGHTQERALQTVGGYEVEGWGAWLFEKIEGDYFTILGLPLLPLLQFLQTQGYGP